MPTLQVDPEAPQAQLITMAASLLRAGRLVAFPTETVYGLGADALEPEAVQRIFAAKGRPSYNPLIAHVGSVEAARSLVTEWPEQAQALAERFWPGPLTLVLPRCAGVAAAVTAGLDTIAVRVPGHPVALALLQACGFPIAAPSANRSGMVSPTSARHVENSLGDKVELILDGGPCSIGLESTVVDLSAGSPAILRPGAISRAQVEAVIGRLSESGIHGTGTQPRPSPGMLLRHYAPRAAVSLFEPEQWGAAQLEMHHHEMSGQQVGSLLLSQRSETTGHSIEMAADPAEYARALYAALHTLDNLGCDRLWIERVPDSPDWDAVRDRLSRAAHSGRD